MTASSIVSFFIQTFSSIFVTIWQTMESIPISFGGFSIGLGSFSLCIIVIGVILTIFLSFVNVGNVRTSFADAEMRNRRDEINKRRESYIKSRIEKKKSR